MAEILLITGLSGAGRSQAADVLEDLGWFVVDNMPVELVDKFVELAGVSVDQPSRLALVIGVASQQTDAVKSVPPSIREAALGIGASPVQVVFHHVLPLALPGILTGTIIGMARALGETAPLLMIGMRAFIPSAPQGFTDATTALPVQIYLWSDEVNQGFVEKTSAAIIVLLIFLLGMNALAIYLRNRFETRW